MPRSSDLDELLGAGRDGPCVSICQPTHRHHPDNKQDPIRFRNLLDRVRASLQHTQDTQASEALLAPLAALEQDTEFWNRTADGLAVYCASGLFKVLRVQRPLPELAIVADSFHVKPLLRIQQSAERFHLLALARGAVRLYEGNRDALDEVELAEEVPRSLEASLGERPEPEGLAHSYGTGPAAPGAGANRGAGGAKTGGVRHGHGSKKDVIDTQTESYFRAVDRAVTLHHSKPSGLPLLLAALPEYHAPFRAASHNPQLVEPGIEADPQALSSDELRTRAWQVLEPLVLRRFADLLERHGAAQSAGRGDDRLPRLALAATEGRIETLLVEAERQVPGRLDLATGTVRDAALEHPAVDDVLDDLAEQVLRTGGEVIVVPAARMPTHSGAAAIFRY